MSLSSLLIIFSSSFMALFPVINPLGNGFVVNGFFANLDPSQRKTAIQKLTINFIMIGVGTLLIGHLFLLIFGLAIPVIQLGGGILICKTAIELLGDSNSSDKEGTSQNVDSFKWKHRTEDILSYHVSYQYRSGQYIRDLYFDGICQCERQTVAYRNQLSGHCAGHYLYGGDTLCVSFTGTEDHSETGTCRKSDH